MQPQNKNGLTKKIKNQNIYAFELLVHKLLVPIV
jgi:hypothetical protein